MSIVNRCSAASHHKRHLCYNDLVCTFSKPSSSKKSPRPRVSAGPLHIAASASPQPPSTSRRWNAAWACRWWTAAPGHWRSPKPANSTRISAATSCGARTSSSWRWSGSKVKPKAPFGWPPSTPSACPRCRACARRSSGAIHKRRFTSTTCFPTKSTKPSWANTRALGLVSYPGAKRELAVVPWRKEQRAVAVPPSHPLAAKTILQPADLNGQDFIAFDEDLLIRRELDRFFRDQGVEVNQVMQFDNIQTIKEAVALGSGISILPERTMQTEIDQGRLISVPLHAPGLLRPLGIVHRKRKRFNLAAQAFLNLLREQPAAQAS